MEIYIGNIRDCMSSKIWMDDSASYKIFSFELECSSSFCENYSFIGIKALQPKKIYVLTFELYLVPPNLAVMFRWFAHAESFFCF